MTAVDSSVLLDVLASGSRFAPASHYALLAARSHGPLLACAVAWAEVAARFPDSASLLAAMDTLGVAFDPLDSRDALLAGAIWRDYRNRGGQRLRMIPDFLVGAHAHRRGNRLLTRDAGFYRGYFRNLQVIYGPARSTRGE